MESALARIPATSHRQAMDWSLALISQEIEATIESAEDGAGWGLLVAPQDYERALHVLRQYRLENRGWPWQQEVRHGFMFDWGSLAWALLLGLFFWLDQNSGLRALAVMDSSLVAHGQWWRLFTAIWLHADLGHLATNATLGLVLLGLAMGRYGTGTGLLAAYLAGAGGNVLAGLASGEPHRSLGASGMVMGALGLLALQSFPFWKETPYSKKYVLSALFAGVMLFVLLGLTPGTDILAHFGGFACGAALGGLLILAPNLAQKSPFQLASGFWFATLVLVPWWLALSKAKGAN